MASNLSFASSSDSGDINSGLEHDSAYSSPSSSVNHVFPFQNNSVNLLSMVCRLCNGLFSSPKVLPCLHSFCTSCLEGFVGRGSEMLRCPICRAVFSLPKNGVSGLPPDYAVINIMKTFPGKFLCFSCKKQSSVAVAKCINCDNIMCHTCISGHNFAECSEWSRCDGEKDFGDTTTECLTHPTEDLKYFCFFCNEVACEECRREDHRFDGHHCEPLAEVGETLMSLIGKLDSEWKTKVVDMANAIHYTEQSLVRMYNQFKEGERRINESYNEYFSILTKHRDDQLSQLEQTYLTLQRRLIDINRLSKDNFEKLSHLSEFCSRLIKYSSSPQCLVFKGHLEARSKHFTMAVPQRITCNMQYLSNLKTFYEGINTCGYVTAHMEINGVPQLPVVHNNPIKQFDGLNKIAEQILSMNLNDLVPSQSNALAIPDKKFNQRPMHFFGDVENSNFNFDNLLSPKLSLPLRSMVTRHQISYTWKFGAFGKMEGQFSEPNGVALNKDDDIIIADTNNNRVQLFNKMGRFKFHFGCLPNSDGQLLFPNRVAITPGGDIVVTERAPTHQLQIYNQYGQFVRKFGSDILQFPRAVAVDKNNFIIIVECKIMRVVIFDQHGKLMHKFQCNQNLQFPNSVAVHNNEIFISDNRSHCVMVYDYSGNFLRQIGYEGLTNYPIGVLISNEGHVLIADNHNNFNLTVFTTDGHFMTAYESKVKHSQCFDVAISNSGMVALTCKDYHVYLYQYSI